MLASWDKQPPDWTQWIAQDLDGMWWAYEHEPNQSHNGWYENEVGESLRLGQGEPNTEWQASLQKWSKL